MASIASREQLTRRLSSSKLLSSRLDADGNVVEVESREDEEQSVKLQEITELLLAAGYFRARIKGLTPFDKVVGGLTWCIETCNIDVDVDLLFQENLTIGQKIALTEKIVAVLPKMNCPYQLEPHQIQGLDFIHIFPVVQWLVKHAIETREEMGDYIRSYSVNQFNKYHSMPEDHVFAEEREKAEAAVTHILDIYSPKRRFRRNMTTKLSSEELQVQSTLLEYGRFPGIRQVSKQQEQGEGDKQKLASDAEEIKAAEEVKSLLSGLHAMEDNESKLSASAVGNIVGLQSEEIQTIASKFAEKQNELAVGEYSEQMSGLHQHSRKMANLKKQIAIRKPQVEELQKTHAELQQRYTDTKEKLVQVQAKNESVTNEINKLEEIENDENKGILQKLRNLVSMNESLKKQEQEFKNHCKEEMARLQANIEDLKSNNLENEPEDQERSQLIEKQYLADKEKLQKIRILLARKNREIAIIQRKIDEVPSRAELSQYQRRFVELYNQVAAKHKETKQFYTLYNTLDVSKLYLSKEVKLLNSILDNFTEAMASQATKEQFLKQFEQIVDGIKMNRVRLEKKKQEEKMRRDILSDTYLDLVEKQRLYFKTVKDLKEECRKNEILLTKLKTHGQ